MWLLDHNIPQQLADVLKSLGINCDTASNRGWSELQNGELLSAANDAGFTCILTKDSLFAESAARAMNQFSQMAIVLITIPQSRGPQYVEKFLKHWKQSPISTKPQEMIRWPSS